MSKTHFTYKKLSESELKNLYNEIQNNQREMTEDELESLMGMFWEKSFSAGLAKSGRFCNTHVQFWEYICRRFATGPAGLLAGTAMKP